MFSVAHLELYLFSNIDFYKWFISAKPSNIYVEGDTNIYKSYKVECLLNWHVYHKGKDKMVKYLI